MALVSLKHSDGIAALAAYPITQRVPRMGIPAHTLPAAIACPYRPTLEVVKGGVLRLGTR